MNEKSAEIMIEAQGLCKYYGSFVAISDISFSIPKGQIVAFLGPNGAGKSTAMKILSGFLSASVGEAYITGLNIRKDRLKAVEKLGYLPENGPLYDDMTPLELLLYFGEIRDLKNNRLRNRIEYVTDLCSLNEVLEKPIGKLSRGFRQRVGLAQALLHDPEILIMDEPTAGLDPNQIRDFRSNIIKLGETKTIMISTHILQEVEAVAHRILLVNNGKMLFDGTPAELRQSGSLEEAFYRLTDYGHAKRDS
ncbi:MAG: ABC transporter ATP-binding protein, partial [Candidatus Zixiibacteriota bacterium]